MANGQLQKMKVVSFPDITFTPGTEGDSYTVLVNPENYSLTYEIIRTDKTAPGKASGDSTFNHVPSQSLTFKFLFDGTGVIQSGGAPGGQNIMPAVLGSSNKIDVATDLNNFKGIVYGYDGTTHQPKYIQLQWGPLHYNCTLQKMTVTYKLFNPDGSPLRAEAECTFTSAIDATKLAQIQNNQSPDLTHVRTIMKGDTLPLLCFREYGDSKYYYQVAKFNRLTDFKILIPGTKLIFPPFAK
jgi:hypothetical protein